MNKENSILTLSGILNVLDGAGMSTEGKITILTTNVFSQLDKSLVRPGRIDKIINFDYMKKKEIEKMYNFFIKDDNFKTFWKKVNGNNIRASKLQSFLYQYRKKDIIKHLDELLNDHDDTKKNRMYN